MIIKKIQVVEEIDVEESINNLFKKDIVKSEIQEILERLFEQKVDTTMTDIFYNNKKRITKEEFRNVYNDCKSEGLFMVMQLLRFKLF